MKARGKKLAKWIVTALILAVILAPGANSLASGSRTDLSETNLAVNEHEWEVLRLTNKQRAANGLPPLSMTGKMQQAARTRVQEVGAVFSHTRPGGASFATAITETGLTFRSAAENIAYGSGTPAAVTNGWMNSPGHRANILSSSYFHLGAGYGNSGQYRPAWVQLFFNQDCSASSVLVLGDNLTVQAGTSIDDMGLVVKLQCVRHGASYLPLISEMCSGYDSGRNGRQTVTYKYGDLSGTLTITVSGDAPAPSPVPIATPRPTPRPAPSPSPDLPTGSGLPFWDVGQKDWHYEYVCYVYEKNLMTGTSDRNFSAETPLTRAMAVQILYRLEGEPKAAGTGAFPDVPGGIWYHDAANWAFSRGIALGNDQGLFCPSEGITREQMAAMLYRYAPQAGYDMAAYQDISGFADHGQVSDWARQAMGWCVGSGLITGTGNNRLSPADTVTRAQAAAIFTRLLRDIR